MVTIHRFKRALMMSLSAIISIDVAPESVTGIVNAANLIHPQKNSKINFIKNDSSAFDIGNIAGY